MIHYLVALQKKKNNYKKKIRSFTSLLTLILRDEGKLHLDDKLIKYLPEI